MTPSKLIRVTEGIYRSDNGGIRVFHRPYDNKEHPWVMVWEDISSTRHEKRFRTLAEARKELKGQS